MKKEITWYDEMKHEKMNYGEKGDKYGHNNKMMMGDKKY